MAAKRPAKKDGIPYQGDSLPWDSDGEEAVLSCFLLDPGTLLPEAELTIPDDHFYHPGNQVIFKEMKDMLYHGKPVEYVALTGWLKDKGLFDRVGGAVYLSKILNSLNSSAAFNHYRTRLKDKYLLRKGITICDMTASEGRSFHGEDASVWTEKLAAEALQLHQTAIQKSGSFQGADLAQMHSEMIADMDKQGVPCPFPWFNEKFGGCLEGTVQLHGGKRGIGKSAITRQVAWYTAGKHKIPTEVITFEMGRKQEFQRLCSLEGVDNGSWLKGTLTAQELETVEFMKRASPQIPLRIHDDVKTIEQVVSRIRMGVLKRKTRIWIVDGPQRIKGDKSEGRERELSGIVWALKELAKDHALTIICPIHLNADGGSRGSEDMENHADLVVKYAKDSSHKPTLLEPWTRILAKIDKNRNGPEGDRCLFEFLGKHLRFKQIGETELDFAEKKPSRYSKD